MTATLEEPPQRASIPESEPFTVDEALNSSGFAEFLAEHPDAEDFDMSDEDAIEKRFEIFTTKEGVKGDLRELYATNIQDEMGITLEEKDLLTVDSHIEQQAMKNPEEFLVIREQLRVFKTLPNQIQGLEQQLSALGKSEDLASSLATLRADKSNLEKAKGYMGFAGATKLAWRTAWVYYDYIIDAAPHVATEEQRVGDKWDSRAEVIEKHGNIGQKEAADILSHTNQQITHIENALVAVKSAGELKELSETMFAEARKELLGGVSNMAELTEAIQKKALSGLRELQETGSLQSLDQAQERFEHLRSVSEKTETGVDLLGRLDEETFQDDVDTALEEAVYDEIIRTVSESKMGTNALSRLESALEPFLQREKIGSRQGDEARNVITATLEKAAKSMGSTTEEKAKKLIIARILMRVKQ